MLNPHDLYRFTKKVEMSSFGQSIVQYDVRRYDDIRNLGNRLAYLVSCRHRVMIPNQTPYKVGPNSAASYDAYPAAITNAITLALTGSDATVIELKQMFPQTLNASIDTSVSAQSGTNNTVTNQHTAGSQSSQSNTFGVSLSGGFFGELPVGQLTVDYAHSWESGTSDSNMQGTDRGRQSSLMSGESMSVKDWSCYGAVDETGSVPSWTWGQTYPWDVIQYNYSENGSVIQLPSFVSARMIDTTNEVLLPPSQLSLFGVDFTMKATWLIVFPEGVTSQETLQLTHEVTCYTASHKLVLNDVTGVLATLEPESAAQTYEIKLDALDLSAYALDPILNASAGNGSAIGFSANPFTYPPDAGSAFKIISAANNLQVTGEGFDAEMTWKYAPPVPGKAKLHVTFKILDTIVEYSLLLKHWIATQSGACKLTVTVNRHPPIVVYVDSTAGQGGQNNVTAIELRNTDFSDVNYHDYLVIGKNEIEVEIDPADPAVSTSYKLFALAVGAA